MKYILYIDYTGEHEYKTRESIDYRIMQAKTIEEAIAEADRTFYKEGGDSEVYLMRILKRVSRGRAEKYEATMMRRSRGWKLNDETEHPHDVWLNGSCICSKSGEYYHVLHWMKESA